jgi:hypothetical protein
MNLTFFTVHIPCSNHADPLGPDGECQVKQPAAFGLPQCVKSILHLTVRYILKHKQWSTEEYLFGLALTHIMLFVAIKPASRGLSLAGFFG